LLFSEPVEPTGLQWSMATGLGSCIGPTGYAGKRACLPVLGKEKGLAKIDKCPGILCEPGL